MGPAEEDAVRLPGREAPRGPRAGGEPPLARSAELRLLPFWERFNLCYIILIILKDIILLEASQKIYI